MLPLKLPRPGPLWGRAPMRPADDAAPPWRGLALHERRAHRLAAQAQAEARRLAELHACTREAEGHDLRARLARQALTPPLLARALGLVASVATTCTGLTPRHGQLLAALTLLDHRLAEMATGEGKSLALALAASVAALAGVPVHVVTANDYLAGRDAQAFAPLYRALGLSVASRPGAEDETRRRSVYAADIVYASAKDLAFDFLRDRVAQAGLTEPLQAAARLAGGPVAGAEPVQRGLGLALIDEADAILLDEADTPLILSRSLRPDTDRRALHWQALALARGLQEGQDFELARADRVARLTPAGECRLAQRAAALGPLWQRPRLRRTAVQTALAAVHLLRRDEHYLLRDGAVEVLDELSGRPAPGRQWSRGLHAMLALKEGLAAGQDTETIARTSFQRLFQRYWRLGGLSATLWESRAELAEVYGLPVRRIPPHQPCQRLCLPERHFATRTALHAAAAERAAALVAGGRAVLLATDSVQDNQALSALLQRMGVAHRVLDAHHDAEEAAIVAQAGQAASLTVATRMAGRGTDIRLDARARAAGGLHVLSCQHNAARRHDRQLAGRAARQGQPGSVEHWRVTPGAIHPGAVQDGGQAADSLDRRSGFLPQAAPDRLRSWLHLLTQRREERRRRLLRAELLTEEITWERRLAFNGQPA